MNLTSLIRNICFIFFCSLLIGAGNYGYAQIDSRNQERVEMQQATSLKKTKNDKKRDRGQKIYSNKKQLRNSQKSFKKRGDKGSKRSVSGRKIKNIGNTKPRKKYVRRQPDSGESRRIRTESQRAGLPPKKIKTATRKGEVARTGDISGQRRIRQKSVSSSPRPRYPQPNPYAGRKIGTERGRAKSNKRQRNSVRSATKPIEVRKRRNTTVVKTTPTFHKIGRKKNIYANHEQRKGEQASTKDIAGKKLRSKNYRSDKPAGGSRRLASPKPRTDAMKSGQRFKHSRFQFSGARSFSSNGEKKGAGQPIQNQRSMKNFSTAKSKSVVRPTRIRSLASRKSGTRETAIFRDYKPKNIRSATKKHAYRKVKNKPSVRSISAGRIFKYKRVHPYRGKDNRFKGENFSSKDIAGRTLRTKNLESPTPNYSKPSSNINRKLQNARSASGSSWNNKGNALVKKLPKTSIGSFSGNLKSSRSLLGGGSTSRSWNNNGIPLIKKTRSKGSIAAANYQGHTKPSGMNKRKKGIFQRDIKASRKNSKLYPTQDFISDVRIVRAKPPKSQGSEYGAAHKFMGIKVGEFVSNLQPRITRKKQKIDGLTARVKEAKTGRSKGTELGKKSTLTMVNIGNPTFMGLVQKQERLKVKGKTHASSYYSNLVTNSVDEKDKKISLKILWGNLFNNNKTAPIRKKEFSHKLKYSKNEQSIWETEEREDWYKN